MLIPKKQGGNKNKLPEWIDKRKIKKEAKKKDFLSEKTKNLISKYGETSVKQIPYSYVCSGCTRSFNASLLQKQIIEAARDGESYISCPECGRILVADRILKIGKTQNSKVNRNADLRITYFNQGITPTYTPQSWIDRALLEKVAHSLGKFATSVGMFNPQIRFQRGITRGGVKEGGPQNIREAEFSIEAVDNLDLRFRVLATAGITPAGKVVLPETFSTLDGREISFTKEAVADFLSGKLFAVTEPRINAPEIHFKERDFTRFREVVASKKIASRYDVEDVVVFKDEKGKKREGVIKNFDENTELYMVETLEGWVFPLEEREILEKIASENKKVKTAAGIPTPGQQIEYQGKIYTIDSVTGDASVLTDETGVKTAPIPNADLNIQATPGVVTTPGAVPSIPTTTLAEKVKNLIKRSLRDEKTLVPFTESDPDYSVAKQTDVDADFSVPYEKSNQGILPEEERAIQRMFRGGATIKPVKTAAEEEDEEDYEFRNGDQVRLKPQWADKPKEVFTLSQWDGRRGWIGDEEGRGWYVYGNQIELVEEEDEDEDFEEEETKEASIKKAKIVERGNEFCVIAESGRSMGCYPSRKKAEERLQQVEMFKHMKGKKSSIKKTAELNIPVKILYDVDGVCYLRRVILHNYHILAGTEGRLHSHGPNTSVVEINAHVIFDANPDLKERFVASYAEEHIYEEAEVEEFAQKDYVFWETLAESGKSIKMTVPTDSLTLIKEASLKKTAEPTGYHETDETGKQIPISRLRTLINDYARAGQFPPDFDLTKVMSEVSRMTRKELEEILDKKLKNQHYPVVHAKRKTAGRYEVRDIVKVVEEDHVDYGKIGEVFDIDWTGVQNKYMVRFDDGHKGAFYDENVRLFEKRSSKKTAQLITPSELNNLLQRNYGITFPENSLRMKKLMEYIDPKADLDDVSGVVDIWMEKTDQERLVVGKKKTAQELYYEGETVNVTDSNSPYRGQNGVISFISPEGNLTLEFPDGSKEPFNENQISKVAKISQGKSVNEIIQKIRKVALTEKDVKKDIKDEIEGEKNYDQMAKEVVCPKAEKALKDMADDEAEHAEELEEVVLPAIENTENYLEKYDSKKKSLRFAQEEETEEKPKVEYKTLKTKPHKPELEVEEAVVATPKMQETFHEIKDHEQRLGEIKAIVNSARQKVEEEIRKVQEEHKSVKEAEEMSQAIEKLATLLSESEKKLVDVGEFFVWLDTSMKTKKFKPDDKWRVEKLLEKFGEEARAYLEKAERGAASLDKDVKQRLLTVFPKREGTIKKADVFDSIKELGRNLWSYIKSISSLLAEGEQLELSL